MAVNYLSEHKCCLVHDSVSKARTGKKKQLTLKVAEASDAMSKFGSCI
jgi:hypothetical protein